MLTNNGSEVIKMIDFQGIRQIQDGLFVGEAKTASGEIIYLGFEKIETQEQVQYWHGYKKDTWSVGGELVGKLVTHVHEKTSPSYPEGISSIFDTQQDYDEAINRLEVDGCRKSSNFLGQLGFGTGAFGVEIKEPPNQQFVVYASKMPITSLRHLKPYESVSGELFKEEKEYYLNYRDILMCFGSHSKLNSISFTHMGIFRNPCGLFDDEKKYKNISLILHGFAAEIEKVIFGAALMVNQPMPIMKKIMEEKLDPKKIASIDVIGFDKKVLAICELNGVSCPKESELRVNLKELDHKPTGSYLRVVVDLSELAKCYREACVKSIPDPLYIPAYSSSSSSSASSSSAMPSKPISVTRRKREIQPSEEELNPKTQVGVGHRKLRSGKLY